MNLNETNNGVSKHNVEDKIFNLCLNEIKEFPEYITGYDDIVGAHHTKLLSPRMGDLNMDCVRERDNGNLVNIEHHSSIKDSLLRRNYEYVVSLHALHGKHVEPFIFNTGPIPLKTIDYANDTMFYNPTWINTQQISASQKLNNVKFKIYNNEILTPFEVLDLIWMVKFRFDLSKGDMLLDIIKIYNNALISEDLKQILRKSLVLWAGKFIDDRKNAKKVSEGLNMSSVEDKQFLQDIYEARVEGALMRAEEKGENRRDEFFVSKLLKDNSPEEISSEFDLPLERVLEIQKLNK